MSTETIEAEPLLYQYRRFFANQYLHGDGIEVGALNHPLALPETARIKYVDRLSVADLRRHYPELADEPLVEVDIIDNGEHLQTVEEDSQDFVIANHFIEHCQDPITTIENLLRVLKKGGILYLAVPDKRYSFDSDRPITSFEHLLKDYQEGPENSKVSHYQEWAELVLKETDKSQVQDIVKKLIKRDYSIHFHVWESRNFLDFLVSLKNHLNFPLEVQRLFQNSSEFITILTKSR
ncbi:MAG: methyltransferase domain-containing protein [Limnospira sp. PMC 1286.21]|uniref:methyltransferase domain-containing protein n=1 Tax=unclassified Limnospira TaxID=2642885 RepID=UPI0028E101B8|nr:MULTISPECIES: methyltransferase domain-containing protein [unclassified Limnospira]MDT9193891.1 methyltransferase domain-containing protein [Limnospira sp. PMC 1245.20]MDT9204078.1 methyltransferase domain-containing protein [Limnospira sp. PMC 1243.20]MDT9209265.1 methyltransferase domain-containing protein [Limnospira sp. PMC 1252.20]MDT9214394.1 methyltransferase domain-containing protein [Limnospira sp. PMC 1256.20]MDT9219670.1 methyltransferase domain-containing protein [Limnospira sp.